MYRIGDVIAVNSSDVLPRTYALQAIMRGLIIKIYATSPTMVDILWMSIFGVGTWHSHMPAVLVDEGTLITHEKHDKYKIREFYELLQDT